MGYRNGGYNKYCLNTKELINLYNKRKSFEYKNRRRIYCWEWRLHICYFCIGREFNMLMWMQSSRQHANLLQKQLPLIRFVSLEDMN